MNNSKKWVHIMDAGLYGSDEELYIIITEDNKVYALNDWEVEFSSNKAEELNKEGVQNIVIPINKVYLDCEAENLVEDIEIFKKLELSEDELYELKEFFMFYLNTADIIEDPFISSDELGTDTLTVAFRDPVISIKTDLLEDLELIPILTAIGKYYRLPYVEGTIWDNDIEDLYCSPKENMSQPECRNIWENVLDLIFDVVSVSGYRYEYNDGAYNRESGYSREGYYFGVDDYDDTSVIDREKEYLGKESQERIDAKRLIISFLQHYRPLGVRNLTKFRRYIGLEG